MSFDVLRISGREHLSLLRELTPRCPQELLNCFLANRRLDADVT
jgi:hypothetical protein